LRGYDAAKYVADPATDTLDDLFARVVMLDDGECRSVIVRIDCCLINESLQISPHPNKQKWV
jgi:hypothetical protein